MVSQTYSHHCDKQYNRAFSPYVGSSGYAEARVFIRPPPDTRSLMSDHQGERTEPPTRKRIAVACGRCRQRKIRCSGDSGQNIPCTNCKNAGVTQCLFLRVSSRETSIKGDLNLGSFSSLSDLANLANLSDLASLRNNFNYNPEAARALATRSTVSPQSYGIGTNNSATGTASPGTSGHDLDYRAPLYPYKSHRFNTQPWGTGYGKDCVDYTFPSCNSYGMSSADNVATSTRTGDASSVSTDHRMIAYQPWDTRSRQYSADIETPQTMIPPSAAFLTANMPSNVSPRPSERADTTVALKTTIPETSGSANMNSVIDTGDIGSSSTTSLAYRLAPAMDGSVYNHSSAKLDDELLRNSIEMDRIPSETMISMPRYKVCDISRSAAPSPVPDSRVVPHYLSQLAIQSIPHTVPHSVSSSIFDEMPQSVTSSMSRTLPQRVAQATTQAMPPLSTYTGHVTTDNDHIAALNYPGSNCSSSIANFAYENYHSSASNQVGHFNELDSNAGTHVTDYSPSASAACHENYTHEPGFKAEAEHDAVSIVCPQSKETVIPATSTEHVTRMPSTHTIRVYSPAERPAPLPTSLTSSPTLHRRSQQDTRSESICVGDREQKLLVTQHAPSHRLTGTHPQLI